MTAENVILGLSITSHWRQCLEILESIKFVSKPSAIAYTAIVNAALKNNDEKTGWRYLNESISTYS